MAVRALFVAGLLVAVTACSSGDSDDIPGATLSTAITTTAAPATTAATTTVPATTTSPAGELTPELEAELVRVYEGASRAVYETLLDPDPVSAATRLAMYWNEDGASGFAANVAEWAEAGWRAEPGPNELHYQEVRAVELLDPDRARLVSCNVSDAAVFDTTGNAYLDPGTLGSGLHEAELHLVDERWLVVSDVETKSFGEQVGCDA